jgi:hypothetical protein
MQLAKIDKNSLRLSATRYDGKNPITIPNMFSSQALNLERVKIFYEIKPISENR